MVWWARPGAFRLVPNTFVAAQALIVAGYVLVPTAPLRMVPWLGTAVPWAPGRRDSTGWR